MGQNTVYIASDHAGFDLKQQVVEQLRARGLDAQDLGCHDTTSVDYPAMADRVSSALAEDTDARGVLVCGSGIGISIAANRAAHVRCALCHDVTTARLCREHNDANVLALGARTTGANVALDCLDAFLGTEFEGGRHARRVEMLGQGA